MNANILNDNGTANGTGEKNRKPLNPQLTESPLKKSYYSSYLPIKLACGTRKLIPKMVFTRS